MALAKDLLGSLPKIRRGLVTIVDDVIGEGKMSTISAQALINLGYRVEVCTIFSYLPEMKEFMSKIKIVSLLNIHEFCNIGEEINYFTKNDVSLIKKECRYSSRYNKKI